MHVQCMYKMYMTYDLAPVSLDLPFRGDMAQLFSFEWNSCGESKFKVFVNEMWAKHSFMSLWPHPTQKWRNEVNLTELCR
jgi:hypothetical protein